MQKSQRPHIIAEHQRYKKNDTKKILQINSYSNNKYKYRYREKKNVPIQFNP